ncbi:MAG: triose-phosphate isomerase [Candidatus Nealsonbacteria bacterium]|nr:triose-phosphate isomerase [Candidatus Nealsonbacteria bacterium]
MKPLIVANWKMNPATLEEAKNLFDQVKETGAVICPPFVYLSALRANGAQDCFWEEKGAFTGEISAQMLKDLGVEYVILGHSERRKYQKETDEIISKKIKAALGAGLKVILCIDRISQIKKDLQEIENWKLKIENLTVAYEPLFAIGTGKACPPERAEKMKIAVKKFLGPDTPVLYGGSVNSQNAGEYVKDAGFDGLLVGGASLKPVEFIDIIKNVC